MTAVAHLNALYSAARIVLWVEDPVTRDYLTKVLTSRAHYREIYPSPPAAPVPAPPPPVPAAAPG